MIEINENGEVIINGQKITATPSNPPSKTTRRTVVIKNGKVVKNDFSDGENNFDMEDFQNDFSDNEDNFDVEAFQNSFIDQMGPAFQHLKNLTKIKCDYCGSVYKSSKNQCPNCGATNNSI